MKRYIFPNNVWDPLKILKTANCWTKSGWLVLDKQIRKSRLKKMLEWIIVYLFPILWYLTAQFLLEMIGCKICKFGKNEWSNVRFGICFILIKIVICFPKCSYSQVFCYVREILHYGLRMYSEKQSAGYGINYVNPKNSHMIFYRNLSEMNLWSRTILSIPIWPEALDIDTYHTISAKPTNTFICCLDSAPRAARSIYTTF